MKSLKTLVCILILFVTIHSIFATGKPSDDLKRSVALMAKIGACWSPSFSPDGKQIAFVSDLTGIPQIWTVSASGGWPTQVTALDDRVGAVEWSPDGEMLAFSVAPGGGMNQQVYLVKPDGTAIRRLTDGGKETNWLGGWTFDGKRLTLASNRRSAGAMDAYLADIATGELKLIAINKGVGRFTDTSRDGQRALLARTVSRGNNNLFLVELSTGDETLLTPHDGPGSFSGRLSPDGKSVYLSSNKNRDLSAFAKVTLDVKNQPGEIEVLAERKDAELASLVLNKQGTRAALVWNVAGVNHLDFMDLATQKLTKGPKLPAEIVGSLTFQRLGIYWPWWPPERRRLQISGCWI